jgi:protein ImuB
MEAGRRLIWADARSLPVREVCSNLVSSLQQQGVSNAQCGASKTAIVAEVATFTATPSAPLIIELGQEREFLDPQPVLVLGPSPQLRSLFDGVGIEKCGDLARLDSESVEVRFGAEGVQLWRLALGDDRRMIFGSAERSLPEATLDWVDYTLTDPERLVFVINALVDNVCTALGARGQCAREMTLVFSLANRTSYEHLVRPSRSTSSRKAWMRLIRTHLDTIVLADAVTGIALRVETVTGEVEWQGDIFDRGFATARATEETVAQLLDDQGAVIVVPSNTRHPLLERRTSWLVQEPAHAARTHVVREAITEPVFTLQLLQTPRQITVKTARRRDHDLPVKFLDTDGWVMIESVAGPDRVSGGRWDEPYAREYFRCVTEEGTLVWIFREERESQWYMQGWWD